MTIHTLKFPTVTELHDGLARRLLFARRTELDDCNSVDVQLHNVVAEAKSFEWDYLVNRLWVPRTRWTTMVRQYVDPGAIEAWLDVVENRFPSSKRGIAVLRTNTVQARHTGRGVTRRWGSCMLSLSVRVKPRPQITLHSRTCYLGYLSVLDLTVAYVCAKLAAERIGRFSVDQFSFVWQLEMAQFHGFRCLAWPLGDFALAEEFSEAPYTRDYPGLFIARRWLDNLNKLDDDGVLYGDMKFASYKRIRRRWHAEMFDSSYYSRFVGGDGDGRAYRPLPDLHVDELDFSTIGIGDNE